MRPHRLRNAIRDEPIRTLFVLGGVVLGMGLLVAMVGTALFMAPDGQSDPAGNGLARAFHALILFGMATGAAMALGAAWGALRPAWWAVGMVEAAGATCALAAPALWFMIRNLLQPDTYWLPAGSLVLWPVGIGLAVSFASRSMFAGWRRALLAPWPLLLVPMHPLALVLPDLSPL